MGFLHAALFICRSPNATSTVLLCTGEAVSYGSFVEVCSLPKLNTNIFHASPIPKNAGRSFYYEAGFGGVGELGMSALVLAGSGHQELRVPVSSRFFRALQRNSHGGKEATLWARPFALCSIHYIVPFSICHLSERGFLLQYVCM